MRIRVIINVIRVFKLSLMQQMTKYRFSKALFGKQKQNHAFYGYYNTKKDDACNIFQRALKTSYCRIGSQIIKRYTRRFS